MKRAATLPILILFASLPFVTTFSQTVDFKAEDREIFERYAKYIAPYRSQPLEMILHHTAVYFLGTPYVGGTLDRNNTEKVVINLREMDCVTFVESVIALALTAASDDLSFDQFAARIERIRYRNGIAGGYDSRLHYTSDWVYDNVRKGILSESARQLGGIRETKPIDFMTAHRSAYRALEKDDEMLGKIRAIEESINARGGFYYLPKGEIESKKDAIPHMAMIAFTTSVEGLDTSHTAFAYKSEGRLTFIHASSARKKVVIDETTLSDYCERPKSCTGIMVMPVLGDHSNE